MGRSYNQNPDTGEEAGICGLESVTSFCRDISCCTTRWTPPGSGLGPLVAGAACRENCHDVTESVSQINNYN